MEITYYKKLDSTHKFLLSKIKNREIKTPIMIVADEQSSGIGTHSREWESFRGNLFLSFSNSIETLPSDLPLQSISIYFAYLMKEILESHGSNLWLKWPNDFYIHDKKIGGVLSQIVGDKYICSIGLNLVKSPPDFEILDIKIDRNKLVNFFLLKLKEVIFWKNIFSKYQIEFTKSKKFSTTVDGKKIFLKDASLENDGSIIINQKKVYSLR